MVGLLRIVPGFHTRVRQEWTLLSFLLYGIAILPVLGNDEFHGVEGYETASLLILAVGAGLYLIGPQALAAGPGAGRPGFSVAGDHEPGVIPDLPGAVLGKPGCHVPAVGGAPTGALSLASAYLTAPVSAGPPIALDEWAEAGLDRGLIASCQGPCPKTNYPLIFFSRNALTAGHSVSMIL